MRMSSVKLSGDHLVVFEGADDFPVCFSSRRCSQILVVVRCAGKVLGQEVFDEGNLEGVLPDDFLIGPIPTFSVQFWGTKVA